MILDGLQVYHALVILGSLVGGAVAVTAVVHMFETFNSLITSNPYDYNNLSLNKIVKKTKKEEAKEPPRAYFFGRLGDENIVEEGLYEEDFLTYSQYIKWTNNDKRAELLAKNLINKKDLTIV